MTVSAAVASATVASATVASATDVSATDARVTGTAEKSLWHYLALGLSAAVLVLVVALAMVVIVVPKIAGGIPLTVLTSSMEPRLPPGTLIVVRPVDPAELQTGDVATYQIESGKPGVITHRITGISLGADGQRSFVFKGDNNGVADAESVRSEQIQGKLWYSVPYIGYANNAVNGENKSWIIPAAAALLLAYGAYMIAGGALSAVRTAKKKKSAVG